MTKTLLIAGEGSFGPTPSGARGAMLRAYDKATGAEVGAVQMPAPQTGSPMTYMLNGRQYLVVAISGAGLFGRVPGAAAAGETLREHEGHEESLRAFFVTFVPSCFVQTSCRASR